MILFLIGMVLLNTTLLSKSTCEDDKSFQDSYGWTCRDYNRVPSQCTLSKKYEKERQTALTSCCVCREVLQKSNFLHDSGAMLSEHFETRRRQSYQCLSGCTAETEGCKDDCENEKTSCESRCSEVKTTCDLQCQLIDEEEEEEEEEEKDIGGAVGDDDVAADSSNLQTMVWIYILIGALVILVLFCCCFIVIFLMRNRVKTAVAGPSSQFVDEGAPMVTNSQYIQDNGDWYGQTPYSQYKQTSEAPYQTGPVY